MNLRILLIYDKLCIFSVVITDTNDSNQKRDKLRILLCLVCLCVCVLEEVMGFGVCLFCPTLNINLYLYCQRGLQLSDDCVVVVAEF